MIWLWPMGSQATLRLPRYSRCDENCGGCRNGGLKRMTLSGTEKSG